MIAADPETAPDVAAKLRLIADLLHFAEAELSLPTGNRYRRYVARDGVPLWNVVAAPEFAVEALPRCYPVVGCAIYRGYFSKQAAEREAVRLEADYDVYISPVAAYSTLGWFDDPILKSFLGFEAPALADLIFHELAHSVVYVQGDSVFNESFASFVGNRGAVLWLQREGGDGDAYEAQLAAQRAYGAFLRHWRDRLAALYAQPIAQAAKRRLKAAAFHAMRACYRRERRQLGNGLYDAAMARPFNNARLALVGAYADLKPGFERLFDEVGGDWSAFYARVGALAEETKDERRHALGHANEPGTARPGFAVPCAADE